VNAWLQENVVFLGVAGRAVESSEIIPAWLNREINRPLGWKRRLLVSVWAILAMAILRLAVEPIIGADISFTAFFPIVILAVLSGGVAGGGSTIVAGSLIALAFSAAAPWSALRPDAASRLIVWFISSLAVASVALGLRYALGALRSRNLELQQSAERLELVVGELEHRGRNALSIVQALSHEAARQSADINEYEWSLSAKMQALAASYEFLVRRRPTPILLGSLVEEALMVFRSRVDIEDGPVVWMRPEASMSLVLALHELATNAVKYGSLFGREGRVVVRWTVEGERLSVIWEERQGPAQTPRSRGGFGSRLIPRAMELLPGGSFNREFQATGLICTLTLRFGPEGPALPEPAEEVALGSPRDTEHPSPLSLAASVGGLRKRRSF
jgi:two-component sensor histidine kinase